MPYFDCVVNLCFFGIPVWLLFFVFLGTTVVLTIAVIAIPLAYRRWMGTLGKKEFRNLRGHLGIIHGEDGYVSIEKLARTGEGPGLVLSIEEKPKFGRVFFTGKNTTLHPKNAPSISFIDASSGLAASSDVAALTETLMGKYPIVEFPKIGGKPVIKAKNLKMLLLEYSELYYYPKVASSAIQLPSEDDRKDPEKMNLWFSTQYSQSSQATKDEIDRQNSLSFVHELMTGVRRTVISIKDFETEEVAGEGMIVKQLARPILESKLAEVSITKVEETRWLRSMVEIFAHHEEFWPAWAGGREVDFRSLGEWNVTGFNQGQVQNLMTRVEEITKRKMRADNTKLLVLLFGMAAVVFAMGIAGYVIIQALK